MAKRGSFQRARENWQDATDASADQRARMVEDLKFSDPSDPDQWDPLVLKVRGNTRSNLVFDQTRQFISQVVNDARMNKPQIQTIPASSGSNEKVSEALDGIIRHIEYRSSASIAYDTALEHAAVTGMGWFRIHTVEVDDPTTDNAQEIRIARIHDPLSVKFDPNFTMPDGSDQTFGFVESRLSVPLYKRKYGKKLPKDWADDESGWWDEKTVRIAHYYEIEVMKETHLSIDDPDNETVPGYRASMSETEYRDIEKKTGVRLKVASQGTRKKNRVIAYEMDGDDILEQTDFPSQWIPLIPVMGYETWIEGKRSLCGMVRRMMPAQRAYNFERNAELEWMSRQPKAPFMVAMGAVEGHEQAWANLNSGDPAYLVYNHIDAEGNEIPPPSRSAPPNPGSAFAQMGIKAYADIQASIGMFKANLGAPSNETSGIAIKRREQQGDTANYHYNDNLSRSIAQAGRILVDMIPKIYDTKRAARILGLDGKSEQVVINPKLGAPVQMDGKKVVEINLTTGEYDVRCKSGPAYASLREEAADSLTKIVQSSPQLMTVLGPMWARMQDWPEAEKISELLMALAPPQVQQIESGKEQIPPQVQAQLQEMQGKMQQDQQRIQQLSDALVKAADEHQKAEAAQRDRDEDQRITMYKAATDRLKLVMPLMTPVEISGIAEETFRDAGIDLQGGLPPMQPPPMAPNPNQPVMPAQQ